MKMKTRSKEVDGREFIPKLIPEALPVKLEEGNVFYVARMNCDGSGGQTVEQLPAVSEESILPDNVTSKPWKSLNRCTSPTSTSLCNVVEIKTENFNSEETNDVTMHPVVGRTEEIDYLLNVATSMPLETSDFCVAPSTNLLSVDEIKREKLDHEEASDLTMPEDMHSVVVQTEATMDSQNIGGEQRKLVDLSDLELPSMFGGTKVDTNIGIAIKTEPPDVEMLNEIVKCQKTASDDSGMTGGAPRAVPRNLEEIVGQRNRSTRNDAFVISSSYSPAVDKPIIVNSPLVGTSNSCILPGNVISLQLEIADSCRASSTSTSLLCVAEIKQEKFDNEETVGSIISEEESPAVRKPEESATLQKNGDIKTRWKTMKDYYGKLKKSESDKKRSNAETSAPIKWPYYTMMRFLDDCNVKERTMGNTQPDTDQSASKDSNTSSRTGSSGGGSPNVLTLDITPNIEEVGIVGVQEEVDLEHSQQNIPDHTYTPQPKPGTLEKQPLRHRDQNSGTKRLHLDSAQTVQSLRATSSAISSLNSSNETPRSKEMAFGEFVARTLSEMSEKEKKEKMIKITSVLLT